MIPLKALPAKLKAIGANFVPVTPEPALKAVDQYLIGRVHESFDTRTTPDGQPWPGDATLKRSGGLFAAATAHGTIAGGTLTRKTSHKLSAILQHGARKQSKRRKAKAVKPPKKASFAKLANMLKRAARAAKAAAEGKVIQAVGGILGLLRRKRKQRPRQRVRKGAFRIPPRPFEGLAVPKDVDRITEIIADRVAKGRT